MMRSIILQSTRQRGIQRLHARFSLRTIISSQANDRYVALEQKSRQFLQQQQKEQEEEQPQQSAHIVIPQLVAEWHSLLPQLVDDNDAAAAAVARMDDLVAAAGGEHHPKYSSQTKALPPTTTTTSQPYRQLLDAYSSFQPNGPQALAVLHAWNEEWMGDLEQAPRLADYHAVLRAYAQDTNDEAVRLEGAHVAVEILQQLDQWGYAMRPVIQTYALAAVCIANGLVSTTTSGEHQQHQQEVLLQTHLQELAMKGLFRELQESDSSSATEGNGDDDVARWVLRAVGGALQCLEDADDWREWARLWNSLVPLNNAVELIPMIDANSVAILRLSYEREDVVTLLDETLVALEACSTEQLPRTEHYYWALWTWRRFASSDDAKRDIVRGWLERMPSSHDNTTRSWNHLMMAYHEAGKQQKVLEVWNQMTRNPGTNRDSISYSVILKSLAQTGSFRDAERAHSIWKKMISADPSRRHVQPTAQHYGSVLAAWSRTRDPRAYKYCKVVMDRLMQESALDRSLEPTLVHYTALITAQSCSRDSETRKDVVTTIQEMKRRTGSDLDLPAYVACLSALARIQSVEGATMAQEMLDEMTERPNRACFQSVSHAWAVSGSPEAAERCEALLKRLEMAYQDSQYDPALKPSSPCHVSLIRAYSNHSNGPQAIEVLDRMEAAAAQGLSEEPDKTVFTAVMNVYARQRTAEAALMTEQIFERMAQAYQNGNSRAQPDARSITVLLQAWASGDSPEKAIRSRKILLEMSDSYQDGVLAMKPTIQAYIAVLNACAYTITDDPSIKEEITRIAFDTVTDMKEYYPDEPNEISWRYLLTVIGRHVESKEKRAELAHGVFERVCQEGCVSQRIVRLIRQYIPELYYQLSLDNKNKKLRLPAKWTRHASKE